MSYRLLRDNPVWLYIGSILFFSLLTIGFLLLRDATHFPQVKQQVRNTPTPTPSPSLSVAIPVLQNKKYAQTMFVTEREVASNGLFTSLVISFSVDGLKEYALLDIPTGPVPSGGFPVVILNHGYINPKQYDTVNSYAGPTNFFASQGYIVIKPDYRGNANSDGFNDPLKRFNYPVDVMTVIASVKNIPQANSAKIYLWGHSMGGEVTLTVMEILGKHPDLAKQVKAVVLWAPVTDPAQWFGRNNLGKIPEAVLTPFPYSQTFQILGDPADNAPYWQSINPLRFLSDITSPIQLNHGTADQTVPYSWSEELQQQMKQAGKQIDFLSYPGADHNLSPQTTQALQNNIKFFKSH